ncbi:hypothetical protein TOT_030000130 [Theileria orientalis strain Shintoku]|uniref:Uncharacterized protein n=1 Tax=Theileria orientalis strain Shintoku TaxID=869250 RepID=J4DPK6_THEOR|nr:hypothetical protein TOT_030000130 [Theileria orientalis strain Shintoku]BAM40869.1 hypothetical protein TOT_030000130 [Theileria orientalis strain Shintoku]|eukprot:XP_009691170.1 hypothetical protein TOT_030000130 [Theileria orientalis strain Shintoku]
MDGKRRIINQQNFREELEYEKALKGEIGLKYEEIYL